ncbi:MAG: hypothetical protein KDI44_02550 [Thiothrix sp.]|nr:hypothetical protein [Thiothrix sp.]HPQ96377.1 hypothetical protein [Thiolinea sp.]
MDVIKLALELAKMAGDPEKFSGKRFAALLLTVVIITLIWRLPDIIAAL